MRRAVWFATSMIALVACAGEVDPELESTVDLDRAFAARIERVGDRVFLEGDIAFPDEESARAHFDEHVAPTLLGDRSLGIHLRAGAADVWTASERLALTYCVSTSFGGHHAAIVQWMNVATAEWEEAITVDFIHRPQADTNCDRASGDWDPVRATRLRVVPMPPGNPTTAGWAYYPSAARSGYNTIAINTEVPSFTSNPVFTRQVFLHELGHALGFTHEYYRSPFASCYDANAPHERVDLTPYDTRSVMHYQQVGRCGEGLAVTGTLSTWDIEGAAIVYPGRRAPHVSPPSQCGLLLPGEGLRRGETLKSCDGRYTLALQHDGNLVLYAPGAQPLWHTSTYGQASLALLMQSDGHPVLYSNGRALWHPGNISLLSGSILAVQNDSNMVIYGPDGRATWSTITGPLR